MEKKPKREKGPPADRSWLVTVAGPATVAGRAEAASWSLLWLRLSAGLMMLLAHGLPKLAGYGAMAAVFPDPLGLGSTTTLILVIVAEVFCSVALILGLLTRLAALPLVINMLVAGLVVHAADPWRAQEFALLYAVSFVALLIGGGGRYSLDGWLLARR